MECNDATFNVIWSDFIKKLRKINNSFSVSNNQDLFVYI